jgi:TolB-like protein/DNA-binding winged helix-turn-helix (wHTH) protein/Tfp pilus assembly protein PilF
VSAGASQPSTLRFGVFELDLRAGELRKGGTLVKLPPQPFRVLAMIASRGGEVVTREEIQNEIWGSETFVDFEQGVNHCIKQIRNALGDSADTPRYLETLPRRGYRFVAPVEQVRARVSGTAMAPVEQIAQRVIAPAETPEGKDKEPESAAREVVTKGPESATPASESAMPARRPFPRTWLIAAGAAALAALALTGWFARGGLGYSSVAVLPFEDLSPEKNLDYLADGLSEELRSGLARIDGLRVTGRTSSLQFKGKAIDSRVIGEKLNVAALLEGTVRKQNNRMRISVQLVKAADSFELWSGTFDREMNDLFAVQESIASAVSEELKPRLLGKENAAPSERRTSPEAYNAYLQGRFFYDQRNKENLEKSVNYFQQAIQLDPMYSPAWAGLARAYSAQADGGYSNVEKSYQSAREAANRALQLDPNLGEAHAASGWIKMHQDWNWAEADASYRRAERLEPGNIAVLGGAATLAFILGRSDEAIATFRRAVVIDPLNPVAFRNLGLSLYYAGRQKDAAAALNQALELAPELAMAHNILGLVSLAQEQPQAALGEANKERDPELRMQGRALALSALGQKQESDASLAELISKFSVDDPYYIAEVYAFRGERDKAFEWLERSYKERDTGITEIKGDPLLKSLESDTRYRAMLEKLRLPQ